jgi:anti-sigma factor RsiW
MNCARLSQVLDAWLDGELDAATGAEIEQHLRGCAACAGLRDGRAALADRLRAGTLAYAAPPHLRTRVERAIAANAAAAPARGGPTWWQAAAALGAASALGLAVGYWIGKPLPESLPGEQVVASHIASLKPSRQLVEVASTDRHVVKPWFQGKVDFAPAVRDLSSDGYTLVGGRLDHVAEGQAVAIVYRVREHVISLFVWRAATPREEPLALSSARGFSVASWSEAGLRFAAVSDADSREIERFARLMQARR